MDVKPNIFKRVFFKTFRILNFSRRLFLNVLFFGLLFIFLASLTSDKNKIIVEQNTVLMLNIKGDVVEQKTHIEPMDAFMNEAMGQQDQNPEVLLSDIIDVIEAAATDNNISLLVLKLDQMNRSGLTKMSIISDALIAFKESGKQIISIGENYTQDQYYLASHADEVWLDPNGWVILDGYGRYQLFYKSALDKLNISQHIFRVGTYKSAVEPYMRDDMSEAAKEANKLWLDDLWTQYKTDVAEQRGFELTNFDESAEQLVKKLQAVGGDVGKYALNNKWVDELKTRYEIEQSINVKLNITDKDKSYNSVNFKNYLTTLVSPFPMQNMNSDTVAVVVAKGTILNGNQKAGQIGGDSTAKLLKRARKNDKVKAVVLRVDSPGGSAFASEIIRQEVELLKQAGKPVVASMGTYAASGGYWISAPADKIYAAPTTITGSIGIFGLFMTFENALSKMGIYTDGVGTTDFAGFSPTRPLSKGVSDIIQMNVNKGYQDFINLVAQNRNMTPEQVDNIAQGRVWSGTKAKELGLVDELGGLNDAIDEAANLANLDNYDTLLIEKELSPADLFLKNLFGQASSLIPSSAITLGPVEQAMAKIKAELNHLNLLNDPKGIYTLCASCDVN
jgi:protease-4